MKRMLKAIEDRWKGLLVEIDDGELTAVGRLESMVWSCDEKSYTEGEIRILATLLPLFEEDIEDIRNRQDKNMNVLENGRISVRFKTDTMKIREVNENGSYKRYKR